ncbi:MAG: hypothetical protein HYR48_07430, partial [Gemmatimonadetes bacterium]|nr:hypothetical protein [Gemmatimonadota bacterium]
VERRGIARLSNTAGAVGDTVAVTPAPDAVGDWALTLEYVGEATVSPRGRHRARGEPYRFSYGRFEPPARWTVRYFAWHDATQPRERPEAFAALLAGPPLFTRLESRLDYMWYRPPPTIRDLPRERWALSAEASVTLPPGEYTLRTISDDAVRVWVDDVLVIDHWEPHESAVHTAPLDAGPHGLRVQYYQVGGWTELRLDIVRGRQAPGESPGPH